MPFANFHDPRPQGQDYKIRFAFSGTPYYGAYMTDIIKGVVLPKGEWATRLEFRTHRSLIRESVAGLLVEFADLNCVSPMLIAFGADAHRLAVEHIPPTHYSRLLRVRPYSDYMSQEEYRAQRGRVTRELDD